LLDWVTSGRKARGEDWAFKRYCSVNEIWVGKQRIARDSLVLEQPNLKDRMASYSCFAMLLLYGREISQISEAIEASYAKIVVHANTRPPESILWSLSVLPVPLSSPPSNFSIVRIAGVETESVRNWIGMALRSLESLVGVDLYRKTFF
jgi:urease accessory protein